MGGCNVCRQQTPEAFQLSTGDSNTPNFIADDPKAAKSGNLAIANENQETIMNTEYLQTTTKRTKTLDKKQNFVEHFVRELNHCRTNPNAFASIVENHIQYIEENTDSGAKNGAFYVREGMPKIPLTRGADAFREMADKLRSMTPLNKVELRANLQLSIPEEPEKWTDKKHIAETLQQIKANNKETGNYKKFNFHYDVGSPYSENSFVLQLVDDGPFKGSRSKNLLNSSYTYIGVASQKHKNRHCGYFLFAN